MSKNLRKCFTNISYENRITRKTLIDFHEKNLYLFPSEEASSYLEEKLRGRWGVHIFRKNLEIIEQRMPDLGSDIRHCIALRLSQVLYYT